MVKRVRSPVVRLTQGAPTPLLSFHIKIISHIKDCAVWYDHLFNTVEGAAG